MRHKGFTLVEGMAALFVILISFGILTALFYPIYDKSNRLANKSNCQSQLKRIGLAFRVYAEDYDGKFPRVVGAAVASSTAPFENPYGWADAIAPYLKETRLFQCPAEQDTTTGHDGTRNGFTDYWMNLNLSGLSVNGISSPSQIILSGDGNSGDGTDARYARDVLPRHWLTDNSSPACRHSISGCEANYVWVDGHIKAVLSKRILVEQSHSPDLMSSSAFK